MTEKTDDRERVEIAAQEMPEAPGPGTMALVDGEPAPGQEEGPDGDADELDREASSPAGAQSGGAHTAEAMRVLEAVLFASGEILTPAKLKAIVPGTPDARKLRAMVEAINSELQSQRHPFHIVEVAGGYQIRTVAYYSPWVRQLLKEKATRRLSIQALECLAIIAYRQRITKAEIEAIRGTISEGAMKTLLERRMVTITGRSDKAGRPLLYGTTKEFLAYFGLRSIEELPRIEEFEAMAKEKMGDIAQELEQLQRARAGGAGPAEGEGLPHIERDTCGVARQAAEEMQEEPPTTAEEEYPMPGDAAPLRDDDSAEDAATTPGVEEEPRESA